MGRVQYPLTPEAKEAARYLVEAWKTGKVTQYFNYIEIEGDAEVMGSDIIGNPDFDAPLTARLIELSKFQLVNISSTHVAVHQWKFSVLLMQELRNAVENDFQVSDYFLTFNAVGTIINIAEGGRAHLPNWQSTGTVSGGEMIYTQASQPQTTLEEFLALPETNRFMELIDGQVIPPSSRPNAHQIALGQTIFCLKDIVSEGQLRHGPADIILDDKNVFQPDIFWVSETNDHCVLVDGKYWRGAPDLVVEILSAGTQHRDRGIKFDIYEKYGVREYWVIDPLEKFVEVYQWSDGRFARLGLFQVGDKFTSNALNFVIEIARLFNEPSI